MENELDSLIKTAIEEGVFPGAVYTIGHRGRLQKRAHGRQTYCPESRAVTHDTIWDLASVSKVVGTTTAAMILYDEGKLKLDQPVAEVLPEFGANGKAPLTVRNLLVHDSGLIAFRPYHRTKRHPEEVWEAICAEGLTYPTGTKMVYSDLNMIALARLMEKLSGKPLDVFLRERVFGPLGMKDTMYNPPGRLRARIAPTESVEPWRTEVRKVQHGLLWTQRQAGLKVECEEHPDAAHWIQGEVHDPTATVLGGVAGHAGLFSTAGDLARFMRFMLNEGEKLVRPETVGLFTKRQDPKSSRGLGWDTKSERGSSAGASFSMRSFGHTGYTGTSVWADPERDLFAILLTNRVHPTSENTKIIAFRPKFHDAVVRSLEG